MHVCGVIRILPLLAAFLSVHATMALAESDAGPPPTALVSLTGPSMNAAGQQVQFSLSIDVTDVPGPCGAGSDAVLGGYVVPVNFDTRYLNFVGAAACSSPQFSGTPTTTDPASANATGLVVVTAVQTDSLAPTGASCVAKLTFDAVAPGVTKIAPGGAISVSSAFQWCSGVLADPILLPARTVGLDFQLMGAIPTLAGSGLIGLALAICFLCACVLRRRAATSGR